MLLHINNQTWWWTSGRNFFFIFLQLWIALGMTFDGHKFCLNKGLRVFLRAVLMSVCCEQPINYSNIQYICSNNHILAKITCKQSPGNKLYFLSRKSIIWILPSLHSAILKNQHDVGSHKTKGGPHPMVHTMTTHYYDAEKANRRVQNFEWYWFTNYFKLDSSQANQTMLRCSVPASKDAGPNTRKLFRYTVHVGHSVN